MDGFIDGFQNYLTGAPAMAFAASFFAGILASLTPCVYPMIPVTVAFIGGNSAGESPRRGLVLSISYVMGLALTYSLLGAVAALMGKMFGSWLSHPAVYIVIAAIFILLGLSMLDVFMLPIPGFLSNLAPKKGGGGILGAFTVGAVAALVAAPCTAPVVLSILTFVATKQNIAYGIALLFTFALGLGLLLVVVGTFAGALATMPKSGAWMEKIKRGFGWLLIVAAVYFLYQAGSTWF